MCCRLTATGPVSYQRQTGNPWLLSPSHHTRRESSMMCQLRLPVSLLILLVLLRCFDASPSYRYFNPYSSSEQESTLSDGEAWLTPELLSKPFLGFMGSRPQRGLPAINSHHVEKRKCNTATCVTQRLADFLARSSNTIGTVNEPTNVGSGTYGKRDLQPRTLPPLVLH